MNQSYREVFEHTLQRTLRHVPLEKEVLFKPCTKFTVLKIEGDDKAGYKVELDEQSA